MGWKTSTLFIKTQKVISHQQLFRELGIAPVEKIESQALIDVLDPDDDLVYIGRYKDTYILTLQDLPYELLDEKLTSLEKGLSIMLPDAEIAALYLHSAVNAWGYSITKNYRKLRARLGNSDTGTVVDFGEPLEEEMELLSKSTIEEDGRRTYALNDYDDEPLEEDQVGENLVFGVASRYLGFPLDSAGSEIEEIYLDGYSLKMPEPVKEPQRKIPEVQFLSKSPVNPLVYLGIGMVLFLMAIVSWLLSH